MKKILHHMVLAVCWYVFLGLGPVFSAEVNVEFRVAADGNVSAKIDRGVFNASLEELFLNDEATPSDLKIVNPQTVRPQNGFQISPVGVNSKLVRVDGGDKIVVMPLRFALLTGVNGKNPNSSNQRCGYDIGAMNYNGLYKVDSTRFAFNYNDCWSYRPSSGSVAGHYFYVKDLRFDFFDGQGGAKQALGKMQLAAGTYRSSEQFRMNTSTYTPVTKYITINTTLIVESWLDSINMPSVLQLDIKKEGSNIIGSGSVQGHVHGSIAQRLRIEARSANLGNLVHNTTKIPYTLTVKPLTGGDDAMLLIDGNRGASHIVELKANEPLAVFPLRFDAYFNVPAATLPSGRYSDKPTIIFTTADIP